MLLIILIVYVNEIIVVVQVIMKIHNWLNIVINNIIIM